MCGGRRAAPAEETADLAELAMEGRLGRPVEAMQGPPMLLELLTERSARDLGDQTKTKGRGRSERLKGWNGDWNCLRER